MDCRGDQTRTERQREGDDGVEMRTCKRGGKERLKVSLVSRTVSNITEPSALSSVSEYKKGFAKHRKMRRIFRKG